LLVVSASKAREKADWSLSDFDIDTMSLDEPDSTDDGLSSELRRRTVSTN